MCDLRFEGTGGSALVHSSKTKSGVRTVFLPGWVVQGVVTHLQGEDLTGEDRLFAMARRTVQKEHTRACEIAGIHDYTIHDHRHTAAVHLARAGMPLHLLQQQLGHARIDMTMRYARFHPDYGDVKAYFERVAEGLGLEGPAPQNTPHPSIERVDANRIDVRKSLGTKAEG